MTTAHRTTLSALLAKLILLSLLPLVVLTAWMVYAHVRDMQVEQDRNADMLVRNLATQIDEALATRLRALQVLADSPLARDMRQREALYRAVQEFRRQFDTHVLLADREMKMLFNTRAPFGASLSDLPRPESDAKAPQVLASGVPAVSDVVLGPIAGEPLIALLAAVRPEPEGGPSHLLIATFTTGQVQRLIDATTLPADWHLVVHDSRRQVIARCNDSATTTDDAERHRFVAHLQQADWTVTLEIPAAAFRATLVEHGLFFVTVLVLAVLSGWIAAGWQGRRLGRAMRSLAQPERGNAQTDESIVEIAAARQQLESSRAEQQVLENRLSFLAQRALQLLELPKLADGLEEQAFMQRGLEMAETLTGSSIAFLHFVHDEQSIELVTWSRRTMLDANCRVETARRYPVAQAGIWADALRKRCPVIFNDYALAPGRRGLPEGHPPLQRCLTVPVIETDRVVMLFGVGNKPVPYEEQDVDTVQLFGNEIWQLIQSHRAQREVKRFSELLERSASEIFSFDAQTLKFIDANRGACRNSGYSLAELRQMTPLDLSPELTPSDLDALLAPLRSGTRSEVTLTTRMRRKDGTIYPIEVHLELGGNEQLLFVALVRDISERQRSEIELAARLAEQKALIRKLEQAQNQLRQSEKLAALGQLAAGVAHEMNNPISFVSSNLGTLEDYLADLFVLTDAYTAAEAACSTDCAELASVRELRARVDYGFLRSDLAALVHESKDGLARVAKIIRDLKDFSRPGEVTRQWADLHKGLESTLNIVWNELKYKCEIKKDYGTLPPVWCEPSQIDQVFMNLLVNAGQAIADKGIITLRTGQSGAEVFVAISDTGCGIPPENLKRVFDPFFTTKPIGQGTGLGLSLSYGIVAKHRGRIEVDSTPGQGTTFTVWLPVTPPAASDAVPPTPTPEAS